MVERLKEHGLLGEMAAEFAGTLILILFGVGVVAQVVAAGLGGHDSITWAWGFGVTLGVYVAGKISGGHLNPAVTIALAAFKGFEWRKVAPYVLAQTLGAFVAALLVRWNYSEVLAKVDPHHTFATQGVFSTLPGNGTLPVSEWGAFRDQIIGTAILLFVIVAITDLRNNVLAGGVAPLAIGFLVVAIGMAWGTDAGYAINPARDFGPRIFAWIQGWGKIAFPGDYGNVNTYFWIPIVGPLVGGAIGAFVYDFLIHGVLIARGVKPDPEMVEEAQTTIEED